jgi:ABC-type transport system substrate-binding protein
MYEFVAELAGSPTDESTVVQTKPAGFVDYLGLVATRPPLDDPRVRRAIAHAIDREALPLGLGATAATSGGLVPPAIPGHSHRIAPAFDPERSRALLQEVGHPGGRGLEEVVLAHFGIQGEAASVIADQLAAVGIAVRLAPAFSNVALSASIQEQASAYIWATGYAYPDPGGGLLEPLLEWGSWLYRDEELAQLLARASTAPDRDERLRATREFERIWIGAQAAVVPLSYNDQLLWRRPWVTGMWANGLARSTFAEAVVTR